MTQIPTQDNNNETSIQSALETNVATNLVGSKEIQDLRKVTAEELEISLAEKKNVIEVFLKSKVFSLSSDKVVADIQRFLYINTPIIIEYIPFGQLPDPERADAVYQIIQNHTVDGKMSNNKVKAAVAAIQKYIDGFGKEGEISKELKIKCTEAKNLFEFGMKKKDVTETFDEMLDSYGSNRFEYFLMCCFCKSELINTKKEYNSTELNDFNSETRFLELRNLAKVQFDKLETADTTFVTDYYNSIKQIGVTIPEIETKLQPEVVANQEQIFVEKMIKIMSFFEEANKLFNFAPSVASIQELLNPSDPLKKLKTESNIATLLRNIESCYDKDNQLNPGKSKRAIYSIINQFPELKPAKVESEELGKEIERQCRVAKDKLKQALQFQTTINLIKNCNSTEYDYFLISCLCKFEMMQLTENNKKVYVDEKQQQAEFINTKCLAYSRFDKLNTLQQEYIKNYLNSANSTMVIGSIENITNAETKELSLEEIVGEQEISKELKINCEKAIKNIDNKLIPSSMGKINGSSKFYGANSFEFFLVNVWKRYEFNNLIRQRDSRLINTEQFQQRFNKLNDNANSDFVLLNKAEQNYIIEQSNLTKLSKAPATTEDIKNQELKELSLEEKIERASSKYNELNAGSTIEGFKDLCLSYEQSISILSNKDKMMQSVMAKGVMSEEEIVLNKNTIKAWNALFPNQQKQIQDAFDSLQKTIVTEKTKENIPSGKENPEIKKEQILRGFITTTNFPERTQEELDSAILEILTNPDINSKKLLEYIEGKSNNSQDRAKRRVVEILGGRSGAESEGKNEKELDNSIKNENEMTKINENIIYLDDYSEPITIITLFRGDIDYIEAFLDLEFLQLFFGMYYTFPDELIEFTSTANFDQAAYICSQLIDFIEQYYKYKDSPNKIGFNTNDAANSFRNNYKKNTSLISKELDEVFKRYFGEQYKTQEELTNISNLATFKKLIETNYPDFEQFEIDLVVEDILSNPKNKLDKMIRDLSGKNQPRIDYIKRLIEDSASGLQEITPTHSNDEPKSETQDTDSNGGGNQPPKIPPTGGNDSSDPWDGDNEGNEDDSEPKEIPNLEILDEPDGLDEKLESMDDDSLRYAAKEIDNLIEIKPDLGNIIGIEITDLKLKLAVMLLLIGNRLKEISIMDAEQQELEMIKELNKASKVIEQNPDLIKQLRLRYKAIYDSGYFEQNDISKYVTQEFVGYEFGTIKNDESTNKPKVRKKRNTSELQDLRIENIKLTQQEYTNSIINHFVEDGIKVEQKIYDDGTTVFVSDVLAVILKPNNVAEFLYKSDDESDFKTEDMLALIELFRDNQNLEDKTKIQSMEEFCFMQQVKYYKLTRNKDWLKRQEELIKRTKDYIGWKIVPVPHKYSEPELRELTPRFNYTDLSALCNTINTYELYSAIDFEAKTIYADLDEAITFKREIAGSIGSKLEIGKTISALIGSQHVEDVEFLSNPLVIDYIQSSINLFDFVLDLANFVEDDRFFPYIDKLIKTKINVYIGQFQNTNKYESERKIFKKVSKRILSNVQETALGLLKQGINN